MAERKAISTRTRFEIFKRDGFRCVYCGSTPNDGPLHVDHVVAVADGGDNDPANLVTACASCNLGKSDVPLGHALPAVDPEAALDHAEQLAAWVQSQQAVIDARKKAEQQMVNLWCHSFGLERCACEVPGRLLKVIGEWPIEKLSEALQITSRKRGLRDDTQRLRYMYGVLRCWRESAEAAERRAAIDRMFEDAVECPRCHALNPPDVECPECPPAGESDA